MKTLEVNLTEGWGVLQDVHGMAESLGVCRLDWDPYRVGPQLSVWEPIARLTHLQLLFAQQPYFGRGLRHFNEHPWWYRVEFTVPADAPKYATLRFEGVDYFAKVWLNGELLGEHEGYVEPFYFDITQLLRRDGPNVLVVCVSSPWDDHGLKGEGEVRHVGCERNLLKGTYEHADTFVQRDVNPVGIWRPVRVLFDDGIRAVEEPHIISTLSEDLAEAHVTVSWPVAISEKLGKADFRVRVFAESTGLEVAQTSQAVTLTPGMFTLEAAVKVEKPELWNAWERGVPALYGVQLELRAGEEALLSEQVQFGIRKVDLRRTTEETTFLLNGRPIYLRGTSYFPDVYISKMDRGRYERDMQAAVRAGMNAIRVHVHTENREFYEICDRLGLLVLQDFDLNWTFPLNDEAFLQRAVKGLRAMIRQLRNHASVVCWIPMNEACATTESEFAQRLLAEVKQLDPTRAYICNSGVWNVSDQDLESGDSHNYLGSLGRGHYTDIYGSTEKLTTEFGIDSPPAAEHARLIPEAMPYLAQLLPRLTELHDYSYRLVKYYLEHYRMQKYAPNSGYFQFMWIDLCPQSFYGVYDYWGLPKVEGLGGILRALMESNQPVGIFMEHKEQPVALWATNDLLTDYDLCRAEWTVTTADGALLMHDTVEVALGPDSRVKISEISFPVTPGAAYRVLLNLYAPDGTRLAHNAYEDAFNHPPETEGHPARMDHELGMRLWWAKGR